METLDTIDSTNAEALRRVRNGARGPLWITAATQTGGRGRQGRDWLSPPGNLYATCILTPGCPARDAAGLSFVVAVAAAEALDAVTGGAAAAGLKWPNDILLGDAKIAGILLEAEGPSQAPTLAIGIGVNLCKAPTGTPYPATDLKGETGLTVPPQEMLRALNMAFADWTGRWLSQGLAPVLSAWRARAVGIGSMITVRLPNATIAGRFADIGPDGTLHLATGGGLRHVTAGDVFFTGPMNRDPR